MPNRPSAARSGLPALLGVAALACTMTACNIGPAGGQMISQTATTYLKALADGDTATACAQLTRGAQGIDCEHVLKARLSRLDPDALRTAADRSMHMGVHATTATVTLAQPKGARLTLKKIGADWRIDAGYTIAARASRSTPIPATPVGRQLTWALAQLNGHAAGLTAADVTARFAPRFRSVAMPASAVVAMLRQTAAERGPFTVTGFAFPPTATKAVALVTTKGGEKGSVRIELDDAAPPRILRFEVSEAPPVIKATGPYTGRFDIGARKLFLHCTGSGSPTVVFSGGLSSDWAPVQDRVAQFTRACSYDPANGLWGQSDPAPTPRTAKDVVADLHALLATTRVPGPYVLAGHSDGGLFAQLYASRHPDQVKGLVLIDAVHSDYYARRIALYKKLVPPARFAPVIRQMRALLPAVIDPEQIDIETSLAQTRTALAAHPLGPIPLFVLTHGRPDEPDAAFADADERLLHKLQDELAALVPHSRHVIARRSGHDIHHQQPGLVISAIRDVVEAIRRPASWKTPSSGPSR